MRILVLGAGKTGKLVAEVAAAHGHTVRVFASHENRNAAALTPAFLNGVDVAIDFTTPAAVVPNMRACLAHGVRMVIGTTGWYDHLSEMRTLADQHKTALLYGTNFCVGMQLMLQLSKQLAATLKPAGYAFAISETHHATKLDAPSGTALTLRDAILSATGSNDDGVNTEVPITANRTGDTEGIHTLVATSSCDRILITHESNSRQPFAEGAIRAAEWLSTRTGVYDFHQIFTQL